MVTFNINIEGEGKETSSKSISRMDTNIQQNVPSPMALDSAEAIETSAPSPKTSDQGADTELAHSSVPHPQDFDISASAINEEVPDPMLDQANLSSGNDDIPMPDDTDVKAPASTTKRKPRATKRKTGGK